MNEQSRISAKSTITSKGQTTVPKEVRDALGAQQGAQLEWIVDGKTVSVTAKTLNIADFVGFLGRPPNGAHLTIEEIDKGIGRAVADRFVRKTAR
ncbi:MAG: AbrB/MazE/SpoVT family DNA-binding domain-containing protein [Devosia sp.]